MNKFTTAKNKTENHINTLLEFEKKFKQHYINKNIKEMTKCIVEMRILQGKMTANLHSLITTLNNYIQESTKNNTKMVDLDMNYYNQSLCENYIDISKKIIKECEDILNQSLKIDSNNYSNESNANDFPNIIKPAENLITENQSTDTNKESLLHTNNPTNEAHTLSSNNELKPTVVLFYASWCGPSMSFYPTWEKVKKYNYNDKLKFITVECGGDSNKDKNILQKFNIKHYPTVKLFTITNGKKKISDYNLKSKSDTELVKWINSETNLSPV